jgi:UDPglucose 6-dehydrogenase
VAAPAAKQVLPGMQAATDPYEAASGAHCLVVCTEWQEFRRLEPARLRAVMAYPIVVDARNILHPQRLRDAGFVYIPMGRPA